MKRIILAFVLLLTLPVFAQVDAYSGVGRLFTSTEGNVIRYSSDYETNYTVGVRYYTGEKLSLNLNVMRDTARIGEYLLKHNYIEKVPTVKYQYTKVRPSIEYWFGDLYVFGGLPIFFSPSKGVETKFGMEVGTGIKHKLYKKLFWQSELSFLHVQDFLVPVANTVNWSFALGYRF